MPDFSTRSKRKELLDAENIPFSEIRKNMMELNFINKHLGGHRITVKGFEALLKSRDISTPVHVLEIGSGGGDNLLAIKTWCNAHGVAIRLTGVDINPECISFARSKPENADISFICSDYIDLDPDIKPDIIFSSLFCHHFSDHELRFMLRWMDRNCSTGFFINDLHRHPLAYYSINALTAIFSRSRLVKHDAPLSVLRSFKRNDWKSLLQQAGIRNVSCRWQWAFRYLITADKDEQQPAL